MLQKSQNKPTISISLMVDRILASGRLSRRDHVLLTSAILSDNKINEEERHQINRIFDYLQIGRLKFVD
ncbi:MAG: hypothetical protein RLZZ338_3187 [Cyanobacteriota bacterium]|jgi:hypothetical protein